MDVFQKHEKRIIIYDDLWVSIFGLTLNDRVQTEQTGFLSVFDAQMIDYICYPCDYSFLKGGQFRLKFPDF